MREERIRVYVSTECLNAMGRLGRDHGTTARGIAGWVLGEILAQDRMEEYVLAAARRYKANKGEDDGG